MKIRIVKDWIIVKTILIFCTILLTIIFSISYFVGILKGIENLIILAPSVFFGFIYFLLKLSYRNKNEIQLLESKIVMFQNKKQIIFSWQNVKCVSFDKLSFETNSIIMDFFAKIILKAFYVNCKLIFDDKQGFNEVIFYVSKKEALKIKNKVKSSSSD